MNILRRPAGALLSPYFAFEFELGLLLLLLLLLLLSLLLLLGLELRLDRTSPVMMSAARSKSASIAAKSLNATYLQSRLGD